MKRRERNRTTIISDTGGTETPNITMTLATSTTWTTNTSTIAPLIPSATNDVWR